MFFKDRISGQLHGIEFGTPLEGGEPIPIECGRNAVGSVRLEEESGESVRAIPVGLLVDGYEIVPVDATDATELLYSGDPRVRQPGAAIDFEDIGNMQGATAAEF